MYDHIYVRTEMHICIVRERERTKLVLVGLSGALWEVEEGKKMLENENY
jgi:hypothetical protein